MTGSPSDALARIATRLAEVAADLHELSRSWPNSLADLAPVPLMDTRAPQDDIATLDTEDLATALDVDPRTVRRWARLGRMPKPMQIGKSLRWKKSAIDTWMKGRSR